MLGLGHNLALESFHFSLLVEKSTKIQVQFLPSKTKLDI